ncbi:hypothetical protein KY341_03970 [Candidatus Woesearchaeota archaeon]|nr:hypothetical protein [Candidatus Woesearchaeota archaeon]
MIMQENYEEDQCWQGHDEEDEEELIYDIEDIDEMIENDEITSEEEGFMNGYIREAEF